MKTCSGCQKSFPDSNFAGTRPKPYKTCQDCRKKAKKHRVCEICHRSLTERAFQHHRNNCVNPSPLMTEEQKQVIDIVMSGQNCRVFARAGTGKTTMSIELCKQMWHQRQSKTLIVTYNRVLCDEVRDKADTRSTIVHNYHTLAGYLYDRVCVDDSAIRDCLERKFDPRKITWDCIIVDEAQDMKELYYFLLREILRCKQCVVLLMGDPFQRLYDAGEWYVHAERYFEQPFINAYLSYSFRISHEMANFVNTQLNPNVFASRVNLSLEQREEIETWWGTGIHANPKRNADPSSLTICGPINTMGEAKKAVEDGYAVYGSDQTVVLATIAAGNSPLIRLSTTISPCFGEPKIVSKERGKFRPEMRNYSTIHQMKGLERDFVVLADLSNFSLDSRTIYDRDKLLLYNLYYTAVTRAKKKLVVCRTYYPGNDFVSTEWYEGDAEAKQPSNLCVTKLCEFVPVFTSRLYDERMIATDLSPVGGTFNLIGQGSNYAFELCAYIGTAIPLRYSVVELGFDLDSFVESLLLSASFEEATKDLPHICQYLQECKLTSTSNWVEFIRFAICIDALDSGYHFLFRQGSYELVRDTINVSQLDECYDNLKKFMRRFPDARPEVPVHLRTDLPWIKAQYSEYVNGRCDYLTSDTVIEIKVSSRPLEEHKEQLLVYTAMLSLMERPVKTALLFYPNTGQCFSLTLKIRPEDFMYRVLARKVGHYPASEEEKEEEIRTKLVAEEKSDSEEAVTFVLED